MSGESKFCLYSAIVPARVLYSLFGDDRTLNKKMLFAKHQMLPVLSGIRGDYCLLFAVLCLLSGIRGGEKPGFYTIYV
ncbi:hypothetical protein QUB52_07880 [Microcoleus sp. A6-C6]